MRLGKKKKEKCNIITFRALTSAGSIPSSRNCCRDRTSLGEPIFLICAWAETAAVPDGSRDLRSCRGLWWEERKEAGCWTGLLPLLDHTSWSRLKLNSPLLSLWGLLRLPFSVPVGGDWVEKEGRDYALIPMRFSETSSFNINTLFL